jgi:FkbM family methyltransferase
MHGYIVELLLKLIRLSGLKVSRDYRYPQCSLNLLELAVPALKNLSTDIRFVQVGASDGQTNDPLCHLIQRYGLKGLFVEPIPTALSKLRKYYDGVDGLFFANVAIAPSDGELDLFVPSGYEENLNRSQKASIDSRMPRKHFQRCGMESIRVQGVTFETLLRQYSINAFEILLIDTEGYDFEVLKQVFSLKITPSVIYFESLHLNRADMKACRALLATLNYVSVETTVNTLAIKKNLF